MNPRESEASPSLTKMSLDEARRFIRQILTSAGVSAALAETASDVFFEAELRDNFMQGIEHMPTMLRNIENGNLNPRAEPEIIEERPTYAMVDGHCGPGQVAAIAAADLAIANAKKYGAAAVAVRNSTDLYMLGYYTERIARHQMLGIGISSGAPNTHAMGGNKRVLGTNPISIALPNASDPFLLDLATSALSMSRVRSAEFLGHLLPDETAIDAEGHKTNDPSKARDGALSPMAGHKGFALSLLIALICGPMTGSGAGEQLTGWGWRSSPSKPTGMGHFFIAIDPFVYMARDRYLDAVERFVSFVRTSGSEDIRLPGDRAFAARAENLLTGTISINAHGWSEIEAMAAKYGVALPAKS